MPAGFQVWDENGVLILDITDKVGKVLGKIQTGNTSGSLLVPELAGKRAFVIKTAQSFNYNYGMFTCKTAVDASGLITWTFNYLPPWNDVNIPATLIYGYY